MEPVVHSGTTAEKPSSKDQLNAASNTSGATEPPKTGPRHLGLLSLIAVIPFLLAALFIWGSAHFRPTIPAGKHESGPNLTQVSPSTFFRLTGTTAAVQSRSIVVPEIAGQASGTLTLTRLAPGGSRVRRGDILAEFDRQAETLAYLDKQAEYQKFADQVVEEQAKETIARAKDETELRTAEDDLKTAELEMQKVEILSQIGAEKAQEALDEAKATAEQLHQTFDLKREAARASIRILEIQRDRAQQIMRHLQANAELMQIHSPLDGVVVLTTIWKEGQVGEVQEGDQVRPGVPFMEVVNPSVMRVEALANQEDLFYLQVGETATIHLDAYPELALPGRLEEIAPVARSGNFSDRLRNFALVFSIRGTDARLMPDLSAAVDVNIREQPMAGGSQ